MKKLLCLLLMLITSSLLAQPAEKLVVKCQNDFDTIVLTLNLDINSPNMLEIFNQGGSGPNFLEASYVVNKVEVSLPDDALNLKVSAAGGLVLEVSLKENNASSAVLKSGNSSQVFNKCSKQ